MAIDSGELSRRLREAREAACLTQEQVAERAGLSRTTLTQIEAGKRKVSSLELDRLAFLYGRDIRDFFASEFRAEDALMALFRRNAADVRPGAEVEAVRSCLSLGRELANLEELLEIDRSLGTLPTYPTPAPTDRWEAIRQGEQLAREERRRLGLGSAPLPDAAELLESLGVRTALVDLPADVSGMTLREERFGFFVVVNRSDAPLRRRFSFAHELAHVLVDREQRGTISRRSERESLLEVRANAFAAALLMPAEGVDAFLAGIAKGSPPRSRAQVFDGEEAIPAQSRQERRSQSLQIYDLVLVAHHFGVSRKAALYRLLNLGHASRTESEVLLRREEAGQGREIGKLLGLQPLDSPRAEEDFHHRFLALALEAYRRGQITRRKLHELGQMVAVSAAALDSALERAEIQEPNGTPLILTGADEP